MTGYNNFAFPLNVYAHLLTLDFGDFQYLHYGLFEPGQQDVVAAQEHASAMLLSRLPPCPCRVLEVGIGLGTTLARLVQAGYAAVGITPDASQIRYAQQRHGEDLPAVCAALENFAGRHRFDLLLFQESAQYIDTAALFRKALELLAEDGQILIMDEMSLRRPDPGETGLPVLEDYLALGEAAGFDLVERLDLSAMAAPTNDYLLDALARYREYLPADLGLDAAALDGLLVSAGAYAEKYRDGRYGYGLLRFQRRPRQPKWLADWAHPADEPALLELFQRAFGHAMEPALWRWKYGGQDTYGALVRRDGRLIAFYGGIPRPVRLFGKPAMAVQIGDVMVDPAERGVLRREGPFFLAAKQYLSASVGHGKPYPLAFGFPSERPYRLGQRLGLYAKAGALQRVSWPAVQAGPGLWLRTRPFDASQGAAVDRLWREMAAAFSLAIIGVRDSAYVQRRYLEHPTLRYRLHLVTERLSGAPFGLLVLRELDDELEVLDIIAPPERMEALVKIVQRLAFTLGKPKAYVWITEQYAALLAGSSGDIAPPHITVPALAWEQAIPSADIDGLWWLTGGDTDFR
jgi:SAM-dependent methyltransferase